MVCSRTRYPRLFHREVAAHTTRRSEQLAQGHQVRHVQNLKDRQIQTWPRSNRKPKLVKKRRRSTKSGSKARSWMERSHRRAISFRETRRSPADSNLSGPMVRLRCLARILCLADERSEIVSLVLKQGHRSPVTQTRYACAATCADTSSPDERLKYVQMFEAAFLVERETSFGKPQQPNSRGTRSSVLPKDKS